jgi:hypothetical protein
MHHSDQSSLCRLHSRITGSIHFLQQSGAQKSAHAVVIHSSLVSKTGLSKALNQYLD